MAKHTLLKQMWAQKRANGWLFLELVLIFVISWVVVDPIYVLEYQRHGIKEGYEPEKLYFTTLHTYPSRAQQYDSTRTSAEAVIADSKRIANVIRNHSDVLSLSIVGTSKMAGGAYMGNRLYNKADSTTVIVQVIEYPTDNDFMSTYRFRSVVDHRWETLAQTQIPSNGIVITEDVRRKLFPHEAAIGKTVIINDNPLIVSAVIDMIKRAPSCQPSPVVLYPSANLNGLNRGVGGIVIRVKEGVSREAFLNTFREELAPRAQIGNFFLTDVVPYKTLGEDYSKWDDSDTTLRLRTILSAFFLLVVFLGVISTFWLRVETRKEEVGLRRALGSTSRQIRNRFLAEGVLLVLAAAVLGIFIQLHIVYFNGLYRFQASPWDEFWPVNNPVAHFAIVTLLVLVLLLATVLVATLIPALRSAKIKPVDALRDE